MFFIITVFFPVDKVIISFYVLLVVGVDALKGLWKATFNLLVLASVTRFGYLWVFFSVVYSFAFSLALLFNRSVVLWRIVPICSSLSVLAHCPFFCSLRKAWVSFSMAFNVNTSEFPGYFFVKFVNIKLRA